MSTEYSESMSAERANQNLQASTAGHIYDACFEAQQQVLGVLL